MNKHLKFEIGDKAFVINKEDLTVDEVEIEEINTQRGYYETRAYDYGREYVLTEDEIYETRGQAEDQIKAFNKGKETN